MHTLVKVQELSYSLVLPALEQSHHFYHVHAATVLLVLQHVPITMTLESSAHQVFYLFKYFIKVVFYFCNTNINNLPYSIFDCLS